MKRTLTAIIIAGSTLAVGVQPSFGQASEILETIKGVIGNPTNIIRPAVKKPTPSYPQGALTRAMNLARQAAEYENGGLNNYRAEPSMYGPATESPYKDNGNGTLTFTFLGGRPTFPPTIQSIVTVAVDGSVVSVNYNGPIQSAVN